jgi:Asp-tRNA(Asn)/Glu-tRNA(Gln) amidotransferase A subunit family amidase
MGIGNYSKKSKEVELPRTTAPTQAAPTPAKTLANALEQNVERDIAETREVVEQVKTYEELLKDAGITLAEADEIRDSILLKDSYTETVQLTKNVSVTFRTRTYQDHIRYSRALERENPRFVMEEQEIKTQYYLAASIEAFRGTTFTFPAPANFEECEKAFEERLLFIKGLPTATVSLLITHLNRFDGKVSLALSKGAVEDF